jgi:Na+-transporting NADH:ubiquinone oxidoreductase subunit B
MAGPSKWLLKQKMMRGVLLSLAPAALWAVHSYGWRAAFILLSTMLAALLAEGAFLWPRKKPVSEAALVTGALLGLSLPPALPLWMGPVGAVVAIVFGKMVFGGFGMNPFNPAMVGRTFIYLAFPLAMTTAWSQPADLPLGGLASWGVDAITGATPIAAAEQGTGLPLLDLLLGRGGGSMGEGARILLILGGLYILLKKYAKWRHVAATLLGASGMSAILWGAGVEGAVDPLTTVLTGGLILGAFYIATDPISAARTNPGSWIYGVCVGVITVLIRVFGAFAEGFMFAILIGNMLGSFADWWFTDRKTAKEET